MPRRSDTLVHQRLGIMPRSAQPAADHQKAAGAKHTENLTVDRGLVGHKQQRVLAEYGLKAGTRDGQLAGFDQFLVDAVRQTFGCSAMGGTVKQQGLHVDARD